MAYQDSPAAFAPALRVFPARGAVAGSPGFWIAKRGFDIAVGLVVLALAALVGAALVVLNPIANPGPLIYRQVRMGQHGLPFTILKFRSMTAGGTRGPDGALEIARITPLGRWLRASRLDELPQAVNVLAGDMSLIGPRPDVWSHAVAYARAIPGYRARYAVRPGISGLAQVRQGHVDGTAATRHKTRLDHVYLRRAGWRLEVWIVGATFGTLLGLGGR